MYEHVELAPPNAAWMTERCVALSAQGSSPPTEALVGSAAAGVLAAARKVMAALSAPYSLTAALLRARLSRTVPPKTKPRPWPLFCAGQTHVGSQRDA